MNRFWIKRLIIIGVFVVAVIAFSLLFNQGNTDMTVDMKAASLPTADIVLDGNNVNEMHGYTNKMQASTIRESITPLGENRSLTFQIQKYGQEISKIAYEIRTTDGERLIEDTEVKDYQDNKDMITATVNLKDLIDENVEYNFVLILNLAEGNQAYYYTRVLQCKEPEIKEKIQFVLDFHNKTFDKEKVKELSKYMEPNAEGDDSSFGTVDIHSSVTQLSYGNLTVIPVNQPAVRICELGEQTASIVVQSIVKVTEAKITNFYFVNEFYRIRHTADRFYLLSYERTMDEYFSMDKSSFANNKIVLGIQSNTTQMMESDGGNILAFENEGRLFSYNVNENKFARLFAFFDDDNFDSRTYYRESDVKLLNVEENGNVFFMVYGYMNRGIHEGEVGVEICYYNSTLNTVEEQIFLPYDKSPEILLTDMEKFSYVNKNNMLFLLLDGSIYRVDISNRTYHEVVKGLSEESFKVSKSNKMIVWQKENKPLQSKTLVLMNLNTEEMTEVNVQNNEYVRPLGFLNEDLIYGVANKEDIFSNQLGEVTFPMKELLIKSEDGKILKNYALDNVYVTDGTIEANQITLTRVEKSADGLNYLPIDDDQITSNLEAEEGVNFCIMPVTDLYETIVQIELKKDIELRTLKFLTPKEVLYEGERTAAIETDNSMERYLVYAGGAITAICTNPTDAVHLAYENMGTVVNYRGDEIYKKGELSTRNQIMAIKEETVSDTKDSMTVCLDTILKYEGISRNTEYMLQRGESAYQILSENMKQADILNLSGCTMDAMLYYVNQDIPVLASLNDGNAVLLIGFNEQNTVLMDPRTGTIYKKGMNDSKTMFEENGNQFITYIRKEDSSQ